ncbi:MAG: ATP-binding protein [Patescibacteria group bacterium]|nr:ATP-binding protein [Patescibacteria group bacterium]MDD4610830.1 ATP-binding protein [Patescibacteria group bacterium]
MRKIVITGGTYAGKSSLVELFKENGFETVKDVGLEVIKELNKKLGKNKQKEFRKNNPVEFYSKIIRKQLEIEQNLKDRVIVFDRGVYDYIAMLELAGQAVPESLRILLADIFYDIVFVCDTLADFNEREFSGRSLNKKDSLKLNKLVKNIYKELGCTVIEVKKMPLNQRFKFIKSYL